MGKGVTIPLDGTRYLIGSNVDKAQMKIGTVIQCPDGQWWEVERLVAVRNTISADYYGFGKKVSAKYAALSKQIEQFKLDWLKAKADSTFGEAAWNFEAGRPSRDKMERIKQELATLDPARVAKVMPGVEVR